jgi:protein involved in polysaccharide export with SLBB domain
MIEVRRQPRCALIVPVSLWELNLDFKGNGPMSENRVGIAGVCGRLPKAAVLALAAFLACAVSLEAGPAQADGQYKIRPQTQLKVTVVEWVPSLGEYREWEALNGEYLVSQSGTLSVPLVGEIAAGGRTTRSLESKITERLKQQTGLVASPVTTVEVVRYPPLFVTGSVDRPGEFEYRPGLTVLQAVAMAGGRARRSEWLGGSSEIDQIRYVGELGRIDLELRRLTARRARLQAELDERPAMELPEAGGAASPQVFREEEVIFNARKEAFERQIEALQELSTLFREEINVLGEKSVAQERQVSIAQAELADIAKLVASGTVTRSRETGLERVVADLQSGLLDLVVASMRAQQRLSETQRDALNLKGQRKTEITRDLQAANAQIEELKLRREINDTLLRATGASILRRDQQVVMERPLRFTVIRGGDGGNAFEASAGTLLEPGDVLDVRIELADMADEVAGDAAGGRHGGVLLSR